MSTFAESFPFLVFVVLSALGVFALVTRGKLSRGSRSAGPILTPSSNVHGQSETSWDAAAVSGHLVRDIPYACQMVAGLCQNAGVPIETPYGQTLSTVEVLVDRLEQHYHLTRGHLTRGHLTRGDLARGDLARVDLARVDLARVDLARDSLTRSSKENLS